MLYNKNCTIWQTRWKITDISILFYHFFCYQHINKTEIIKTIHSSIILNFFAWNFYFWGLDLDKSWILKKYQNLSTPLKESFCRFFLHYFKNKTRTKMSIKTSAMQPQILYTLMLVQLKICVWKKKNDHSPY